MKMGIAGQKYSWRNLEAAAKNTAGWRIVVCGLSTRRDKLLTKLSTITTSWK